MKKTQHEENKSHNKKKQRLTLSPKKKLTNETSKTSERRSATFRVQGLVFFLFVFFRFFLPYNLNCCTISCNIPKNICLSRLGCTLGGASFYLFSLSLSFLIFSFVFDLFFICFFKTKNILIFWYFFFEKMVVFFFNLFLFYVCLFFSLFFSSFLAILFMFSFFFCSRFFSFFFFKKKFFNLGQAKGASRSIATPTNRSFRVFEVDLATLKVAINL